MTTIQTIGTQIAKLRKDKNITQEELAKNLDVSAQAVSKWENGGAPDIEMMPKIADYYDGSRSQQSLLCRFHSHFLRGTKPGMGKESKSCQYAALCGDCSDLGIFWINKKPWR